MDPDAMVAIYDDEAEASGWYGPEVVFGLSYRYVRPGESLLDIGIGTGLGSVLFRKAGLEIHGMDISPRMLDACRNKGFTALTLHDLTRTPYPYEQESMDHVLCVGVLNFFSELGFVFREAGRILRTGGRFAFVVCDRAADEGPEITVGQAHRKTDGTVTMYRHSADQIDTWLKKYGFRPLRRLGFTIFMDRERTNRLRATAYVASKAAGAKGR